MLVGEHCRLRVKIAAVKLSEIGGPLSRIPAEAVVKIRAFTSDPRLVQVEWDGELCFVFIADLLDHGNPCLGAGLRSADSVYVM